MKSILVYRFATNLLTHASARKLLAIFAAFLLFHPSAWAADAVPPQVVKAILNENWKEVVQFLPGVETNGASASLRLIKGHACLALNQKLHSAGQLTHPP
jgi:hypothetical protein